MSVRGRARPEPAKPVTVAQQPGERDKRVTALDAARVEERFNLGQRLDDDPNVFVLFCQSVHASRQSRIDAAAEQHDAFVRIAGG